MIRILCVGRIKTDYYRAGIEDYTRRLRRFATVHIEEVPDQDPAREAKSLLQRTNQARLVVCDERGENWSSARFAEELGRHGAIDFVVGGPDGLDEALRQRADASVGFGAITLPHELARLVLIEQIYRGFTLLRGHPYHR